jgi:ribosomal protein S19E (S16A)
MFKRFLQFHLNTNGTQFRIKRPTVCKSRTETGDRHYLKFMETGSHKENTCVPGVSDVWRVGVDRVLRQVEMSCEGYKKVMI